MLYTTMKIIQKFPLALAKLILSLPRVLYIQNRLQNKLKARLTCLILRKTEREIFDHNSQFVYVWRELSRVLTLL